MLHLNLRSEQLPWARLIGAVLLDKGAPRVATVVNKAGPVGGPFRTAPLVLLAGEPRYVASVCEAGLVFRVDVRSVYWNSRLGPERARLVALFAPGHGVLDLAAGCGPIALQAARRGCRVWAADANPAACEALGANALANGLRLQGGGPHCGCGAAFAQSLLRGAPPPLVHHVVAHAPDGGPELVGAALRGAFAAWPADWALPSVHVYAFARPGLPGDAEAATRARLAAALGVAPHALAVNWTRVRDVAPGKAVLRASFQLPDDMRRQEEA